MNARFFVPGSYAPGEIVELPQEEAHHLTRVLRLRAGDTARVFDGRGREFAATVASASKRSVSIRVGEPQTGAAEPRIAITLAHAVLKGDKMDDLVRDAVMVGATAIQPVVTERTEVTLTALVRGRRSQRWERVAISSAKQCGRAVIPAVLEPVAFDELLEALRSLTLPQPALMLVEPVAGDGVQKLVDLDPAAPREATVLIGPEGGWTADEVERGSAVCRLVSLGGRTLRADAMGLVATAALFTKWGEY